MMEHTLITIGRQFGSGGHEVGNRLAERLAPASIRTGSFTDQFSMNQFHPRKIRVAHCRHNFQQIILFCKFV